MVRMMNHGQDLFYFFFPCTRTSCSGTQTLVSFIFLSPLLSFLFFFALAVRNGGVSHLAIHRSLKGDICSLTDWLCELGNLWTGLQNCNLRLGWNLFFKIKHFFERAAWEVEGGGWEGGSRSCFNHFAPIWSARLPPLPWYPICLSSINLSVTWYHRQGEGGAVQQSAFFFCFFMAINRIWSGLKMQLESRDWLHFHLKSWCNDRIFDFLG